MNVRISRVAAGDLEAITDHIAEDNPFAAEQFGYDLLAHAMSLAPNPRRYALLPGYHRLGYRRCPFKNYIIIYRVTDGDVEIVRLFHSAQDYIRLLSSDA